MRDTFVMVLEIVSECLHFILAVSVIVFVAIFALALLLAPVAYLDGSAKSAWLEQTRGIEIPWYQATWLSVDINSHDGSLNIQGE